MSLDSSHIYDSVFDRVIGSEGGYTNDSNDPGGETNWGISKRAYPDLNIATLTRGDARRIYFNDFWNKLDMDIFPISVSFQLFDFAINSGIETAIRYLQKVLGVADDGYFGPVSKLALRMMTATDLIMQLNAERLEYMTKLSNWPNASKGWARRIAENLRYGAGDT